MVTVGTWNVENLLQPGDGAGPASPAAYEAKLDALADTITSLDPDVLAVQEIGEAVALDDLLARLGAGWRRELADPDGRGIRVGFVSRLEMSDAEQVPAFPSQLAPVQVDDDGARLHEMGRPALRVRVQTGRAAALDLVTCHLKSKLLTFPGGRFTPKDEDERARYAVYALNRRAAEAAAVRAYATELLDGHSDHRGVVVLGDLNDEVQAATTQILLGPPGSEQPGTGGPIKAMAGDCGTSPPAYPSHSASAASTAADPNSSTTSWSATPWSTPSATATSPPANSTFPPSPTRPPPDATTQAPTTAP